LRKVIRERGLARQAGVSEYSAEPRPHLNFVNSGFPVPGTTGVVDGKPGVPGTTGVVDGKPGVPGTTGVADGKPGVPGTTGVIDGKPGVPGTTGVADGGRACLAPLTVGD
jgi:hypothetical protein